MCLIKFFLREKLAAVFNVVQEVNILDSKDEANLKLLKRPELGITFTKLHCWRLTQFEKCVFLDADTLVCHPIIYRFLFCQNFVVYRMLVFTPKNDRVLNIQ